MRHDALKQQSPREAGLSKGAAFGDGLCRNSSANRLPADWRARLEQIDAATYFQRRVDRLSKPNATGWAQGRCPFHDDKQASLSVHVADARGGWRCFAGCGGGDLIGFHQKRTGLAFAEAVRDLLRGAA